MTTEDELSAEDIEALKDAIRGGVRDGVDDAFAPLRASMDAFTDSLDRASVIALEFKTAATLAALAMRRFPNKHRKTRRNVIKAGRVGLAEMLGMKGPIPKRRFTKALTLKDAGGLDFGAIAGLMGGIVEAMFDGMDPDERDRIMDDLEADLHDLPMHHIRPESYKSPIFTGADIITATLDYADLEARMPALAEKDKKEE